MILPDHDDRRCALRDFQRNLVVTAGAGTGKTSLLVGRLLSALVRQHLEPEQILALTFTDNAAAEMHERLLRMLQTLRPYLDGAEIDASDRYILDQLQLGPENLSRVDELLERIDELRISTFHSFCMRFLQEHARRLGLPPDLQIGQGQEASQVADEVFLAALRQLDADSPLPALERFDITELRSLMHAFLDLPEDSLARSRAGLDAEKLAEDRAMLQEIRDVFAGASKNWHACAEEFDQAYAALQEEKPLPKSPWLQGTKSLPVGGKKQLGAADSEEAKQALKICQAALRSYTEAADAELQLALDFIRPILAQARSLRAERGLIAFQDLLLLTRQSLIDQPELREQAGRRYQAILVDEFQDTDPLQYDVIFLLASEAGQEEAQEPMRLPLRPGCLFIVGDAKQSIYRFRRADVAAFARAVDCISAQGGQMLELSANFRSQPPILDLVNRVCAESLAEERPYQLGYRPVTPMLSSAQAPPVEVLELHAETPLKADRRRELEGLRITERIQELQAEGVPLAEMAVLLRAATDTSWLMRPLRRAGVPYVLEGSRRFYRRQEVLLCTALITAMARPHDPVAVLALLRSGLSEASDGDIHRWLEAGRSTDFRLLAADADGPVARCLLWLAEIHQQIQPLGPQAQLQTLLTLPELRLSEAAGFEGPQRIANIERLLDHLLQTPTLDLHEAANTLLQHNLKDTEDEESALFDKGVDALRILTVHKSKGLEFGTVFVPDLARLSRGGGSGDPVRAERLYDADGQEVVTLKIGSAHNHHALRLKDANARHAQAELRRLFYVAATRARRRLILLTDASPQERRDKRPWQDDLAGVTTAARVLGYQDPRLRLGDDEAKLTTNPALQALGRWQELTRTHQIPEEATAPSTQTDKLTVLSDAAALARHHQARVLGTQVHHYLSLVDLRRSTPDQDLLRQMDGHPGLEELVAGYHASAMPARLGSARALHRELPLSFVDTDGRVRSGLLDLLIEERDGSYTILDWKTDRLDPGEAAQRAEAYRPQLQAYAEGVQRALDLPGAPRIGLCFLHSGEVCEL